MRKLLFFDKSHRNFKSGRTFDFIGLNGNEIADNLKEVIFNSKLLFPFGPIEQFLKFLSIDWSVKKSPNAYRSAGAHTLYQWFKFKFQPTFFFLCQRRRRRRRRRRDHLPLISPPPPQSPIPNLAISQHEGSHTEKHC
jgi:hypothetical protein